MPYLFDIDNFDFRKSKTPIFKMLRRFVWWLLGSFALSLLAYFAFSWFIPTEQERKLSLENRMYEKLYSQMMEQQSLIGYVTEGLQVRDNEIYYQVFHTSAPSVDPIASVDLQMVSDTTSEQSQITRSALRLNKLSQGAAVVDRNFQSIFELLTSSAVKDLPMDKPIADMRYAQTGASIGLKYNPFYKIDFAHTGLDIIAGEGEAVLATASGVVAEVRRSSKGLGNMVTIDHGNGYVTKYAHLADIQVAKGQRVSKGRRLGSVGISGNTFAPHLHYEVLKNGEPQDPVNYMFASLSPGEYANVAFLSSKTRQSLD